MKYEEKCECCGTVVTAYSHSLNKGLADAFVRLANKNLETQRPVNPNSLSLSHNQMANFQKLRYFGIIRSIDNNGKWMVTDLGKQFLNLEVPIRTTAKTMGGKVLSEDHPAWLKHTKPVKTLYLNQIAGFEYKHRPEYKEERKESLRLFN